MDASRATHENGNLGSHHTDLEVEVFRGFALADDFAPFVVVNPKDSAPTS